MTTLSWLDLIWCSAPIILVCGIYFYWQGSPKEVIYASLRMTTQLIAVGYVLISIFEHPSPLISALIVCIMLVAASWISIRPVKQHNILIPALTALGLSVGLHLSITIFLVLKISSWYEPKILIPIAGMFFANSMNSISLATERFYAELKNNNVQQAKLIAFKAAMIPQINGLLAVGLVALPGMMTGQILSGVSPLIAVRYQIMIMTMILGTTGLGAAIMLYLLARRASTTGQKTTN